MKALLSGITRQRRGFLQSATHFLINIPQNHTTSGVFAPKMNTRKYLDKLVLFLRFCLLILLPWFNVFSYFYLFFVVTFSLYSFQTASSCSPLRVFARKYMRNLFFEFSSFPPSQLESHFS